MARDIEAILRLKRERNAVILAHNYQTPEIFHGVADIVGDSLALAREAATVRRRGHRARRRPFHGRDRQAAQSRKTVLIPDLRAGCSLADSITAADVRALRQRISRRPDRDLCQHLGRGEGGIRHLLHLRQCHRGGRNRSAYRSVIMLPDEYLARNIANQIPTSRSSPGPAIAKCTSASPPPDIAGVRAPLPRRHRPGPSGMPAGGRRRRRFRRLHRRMAAMSRPAARLASCWSPNAR